MQNTQGNIPIELLNPSIAFQKAMESMEIYWWYWDMVERCLSLSPKLIELLGYSEEEFDPRIPTLGKNIHPDDIALNDSLLKAFMEDKVPLYEMEYRLKVQGEWMWYYNRGTIVSRDKAGKPILFGGITINISGKYKRLLSRIEEGRKFEFIFKNTSEPIVICSMGDDQDAIRIVQVNQAAADIYETEANKLIGLNPYDLVDPRFWDSRSKNRKNLLGDGNFFPNVTMSDSKGHSKVLEVKTHAFTLTGENLIIAVIKDKTETYNFRNVLQASEEALRKSEQAFVSLIKAADDRIGLFDTDGNVVIVNDAFAETLGYTVDEYLKLEGKERVHPEDKPRLKKQQRELFETGYLSSEYRVLHKDGHYLHMSSKSVLLRDPDKDYVLLIIRDDTERINFQQELIEEKERAQESDKLKSAFLANMSHEIRTPMNSIVGFANLLTDENVDAESRKEYVARINKNSEQLLALISDIIDLAKIESNQLTVSYSSVILDNLFSDLNNYGAQQLKEKKKEKIKFNYIPDTQNPKLVIESDLIRLTQIMQNLINNAVKFTFEGEIAIGYSILENDKVRLYVRDTGTGIDRKDFIIIFDQFRQIDGSDVRKFGGTGLGLAICKNLATLLNGNIFVESEKGQGSIFYVELPIQSGFLIGTDEKEKIEKEEKAENLAVMMVDDDPDSLMLFSTMMRNEGIQVITADSGYRALEILEREALPDVVLMDLEMPVLNGVQTLRIIRETYPGIKVIAQSAHALEGDREKTMVAGFDEYISKPYNKQSLLKVIRSFS